MPQATWWPRAFGRVAGWRESPQRQTLKAGARILGRVAVLLACTHVHAHQNCETPASQLSAAGGRLGDNGDGTVTDRQSRLMWLRCSARQDWTGGGCTGDAGKVSWPEAQSYAADVNQRGVFFFNDWRLPKLSELASIAEHHCADPRIRLDVFPGTPAGYYWTASTRPTEGSQHLAYALSFGAEGPALLDRKELNHVRLVRNAN